MSVRLGLLALLAEGPRHGYQLKTEFEARTGGVWRLNVGQVYTTLDRLERDGLVVPTGDGEHRTWKLTGDGHTELDAWFLTGAEAGAPPRDELQVKVLLAIAGRRDAQHVIDEQRSALLRELQTLRRGRRTADADVAAGLMTEALVLRREADLRWLDECERRITRDKAPTRRTTGGK